MPSLIKYLHGKIKNVYLQCLCRKSCLEQGGNGLTSQLIPINHHRFAPPTGFLSCTIAISDTPVYNASSPVSESRKYESAMLETKHY